MSYSSVMDAMSGVRVSSVMSVVSGLWYESYECCDLFLLWALRLIYIFSYDESRMLEISYIFKSYECYESYLNYGNYESG